jgi:hypothetical protein
VRLPSIRAASPASNSLMRAAMALSFWSVSVVLRSKDWISMVWTWVARRRRSR